jgi:hypothetical protein
MSKNELKRLSTLALRQRKAHLLRTLTFPADAIHASFLERFLKCGRSNCRCREGEKHGPFFYLTRKIHSWIEQRSGEGVRRLENTEPNENATRRFF